MPPRRIDILTSIDGISFEEAWQKRQNKELEGITVPVINKSHLLRNKKVSGRPKDLADVVWLEAKEKEAPEQ